MKKTLKFVSYYKYTFNFEDNEGIGYYAGGDHDDIYRWDVNAENEAEQKDGIWYLDGMELFEIPKRNA